MTKIEKLEHEITALDPDELSEFRQWFADFDAEAWDRQFEADAESGALDAIVSDDVDAHRAGRSRPL